MKQYAADAAADPRVGRRPGSGPGGGLRAGAGRLRGWHWGQTGTLQSTPVRCKREQWYLVRGRPAGSMQPGPAELLLRFRHRDERVSQRCLTLRPASANGTTELLGWVQTPEDATHLQLHLSAAEQAGLLSEMVFHPVAERDPKCHPLANVPRWSCYRPPFPLQRVLLPPALESLAPVLSEQDVELFRPRSKADLARTVRRAAWVLDPTWATRFNLSWADLLRLGEESWVLVDLETTWRLLRRTGLNQIQLVTYESPHGLMSARVEYADVPTRGLALQDVFPYAAIDERGGFRIRILRANRAWKRYADTVGLATLLASETPDPNSCGDVLSAAQATAGGELIATDVPWLVAGQFGPLLAPKLARHVLRMHLGAPLPDDVQYWNRWDDGRIVVRDISDLARRYPPLQAVRFTAPAQGVESLGVVLPASGRSDWPLRRPQGSSGRPPCRPEDRGTPHRTLLIRTGRIDDLTPHDGLPPEPMTILMKMLARESREGTPWARRHLAGLTVIWQFEAAVGLRYAANYMPAAVADVAAGLRAGRRNAAADVSSAVADVAAGLRAGRRNVAADVSSAVAPKLHGEVREVRLRRAESSASLRGGNPRGRETIEYFAEDEGIFGDASLEYQSRLSARVRRWIERATRA